MEINHVHKDHLEHALHQVNKEFEDNVIFAHCNALNKAGTRWCIRLRVKSSKGAGARLSRPSAFFGRKQRRLTAACWHVYGTFYDNLPLNASIRAWGRKIIPQDKWKDIDWGSVLEPCYLSELCKCN